MVVILGATGYIGQAFATELRYRSVPFLPITRSTLDYTRFDVLFNYIRHIKPRLVINAAGYTGRPTTASCEIHRTEAIQANTLLPQTVARVCYLTKTPMGHISSGGIYAGAKVANNGALRIEPDLSSSEIRRLMKSEPERFKGFVETDQPNFTFNAVSHDFYSGSKALAEESLRWFEQIYLWRPGPVFDEVDHPRNFLSQFQQCGLSSHESGSLSQRSDFVRACLDLWERNAAFGTYHIVNPDIVSAEQIIEISSRVPHSRIRMDSQEPSAPSPQKETPAAHCILESSKLQAAGIRLRPVSEALEHAAQNWKTAPKPVFSAQLS